MRRFNVVIVREPEGKWTLTVPILPGCVAYGDTEAEVLALAQEGIPFHLECLREKGQAVPEGVVVALEVAA